MIEEEKARETAIAARPIKKVLSLSLPTCFPPAPSLSLSLSLSLPLFPSLSHPRIAIAARPIGKVSFPLQKSTRLYRAPSMPS